jgi:hypothetical protein
MEIGFTRKYERQLEDSFRNNNEAHDLLALIDAEFSSDPLSVQCFDLHVVERVRCCVALRKKHKECGL